MEQEEAMVDEIAKMLIEDMVKKGNTLKPWDDLTEAGRNFWRARADEFIRSVQEP